MISDPYTLFAGSALARRGSESRAVVIRFFCERHVIKRQIGACLSWH
jgi:hypothetical protein